MFSFLVALAVVVAFAVVVYRYAPKRGERAAELLERFRPHAPMADWSMSYYDDQRQLSDLAAAQAHREAVPCASAVASHRLGVLRRAVQF
ncbi:hypothetical protein [Nocardia pseudobrasiliensis]|uniref:Uncharacterized protein n=1 Tax=Nocardia pseudobrasiliensis TaxID=45979 RepID=A0A370HXP7_9NOCA|nr:hypothetical protein [Nocardia pseudobrasiliensis]RDI63286.1 hypothetical protein DFR76_111305 [Nocardia pseudobrasiliensis]